MGFEIHEAARKHGVSDADIAHAYRNAVVVSVIDDHGGLRSLILGPSRSGNLLELVALVLAPADHLVIHAMPARQTFIDLATAERGR